MLNKKICCALFSRFSAPPVETMIETGRALSKDYFGDKFIQPFALEVIDFFQDFPEYSSITDDAEHVRFLARAQRAKFPGWQQPS